MQSETLPITMLRAVLEMTRAHGVDTDEVLAAAGISPRLLLDDRSRVTYHQAARLVGELWRQTDDELIGLAPRAVPRGTVRLIGFALLSAPDLRTAIERINSFKNALGGLPVITIDIGPETSVVTIDVSDFHDPHHIVCESLLAVLHRFASWMIGRRIDIKQVELPYPREQSLVDHDLVFGAPVHFEAARAALILSSENLDAPIMQTEDSFIAFTNDAAAELITRRDWGTTTADQVRRLLSRGLRGDWPTPEDVAARLRMSDPTLRRKLREQGTSFSAIKEELMRDAAVASLSRGGETVADLAERLGFSEPSAFRRAFRRWTGSAPGTYRPGADPDPEGDGDTD